MNYKYISGEVLSLPEDTTWTDGMKLQDIYPNSSFVSGTLRSVISGGNTPNVTQ